MARVAVGIAAFLLFALALPSFADGETVGQPINARYSTSRDKVRFVLDLPSEVVFTDKSTPTAVIISLALPSNTTLKPIKIKDALIKEVSLTGDADGQAVLTIQLAKARKYYIFTLPAQNKKVFRLVMDIQKRFLKEEHSALSSAAEYIRLERQTENRYLIAHIVRVKATDPKVRFQIVASGVNGEGISAMMKRTKADYGINGGFFLTRTRPVGLLKIDNQVHSLPIWNRTALAFPPTGLPVFGNPSGSWKITLPDSSTRMAPDWMDSINSETPPTARVIFGGSVFRVPENPDGVTAVIRAGAVIALMGGQLPLDAAVSSSPVLLEPNDFALYLLGDDAKELTEKLTIGSLITITPVVTPAWEEYPNVIGAGPRLLADGKLMITGKLERFQSDIISSCVARSAIGVTKDKRLLLISIEAPGPYGGGATLEELAALLKKFGAVDAMNLDGGGSSSLAIGDKILKYPATAWERPVACGILVFDENRTKPVVAAETRSTVSTKSDESDKSGGSDVSDKSD